MRVLIGGDCHELGLREGESADSRIIEVDVFCRFVRLDQVHPGQVAVHGTQEEGPLLIRRAVCQLQFVERHGVLHPVLTC